MADHGLLRDVSPTLVVALRRCGLAVYLSRTRLTRGGVLPSSPPARLGAAAHRVLGWVAGGGTAQLRGSELEAVVRERWRDELVIEEKAAASAPPESYFGPAHQWPAFATTQERLVIEAQRLSAELSQSSGAERWVERALSCSDPPMRGTPDLVEIEGGAARVIEFKTGNVEVEDAQPTGRYGLQVLLYAAMVRELGNLVVAAEIRPIGRARRTVRVSDDAIDVACGVAGAALEAFNEAIKTKEVARLAHPSDHACGYCPHALQCPALWQTGGAASLNEMQLVEGVVLHLQRSHSGSTAVEVETIGGTVDGTITLTGLDVRRLPALQRLRPGDRVRASGLYRRPGGSALGARSGAWVQVARIDDSEDHP